jgi:hypothetical protein
MFCEIYSNFVHVLLPPYLILLLFLIFLKLALESNLIKFTIGIRFADLIV